MRIRYQHGHLRFKGRKNGNSCWEFMWREQDASGKRVRRTQIDQALDRPLLKYRISRRLAVESWLRQLCRRDGDGLADSTKAKLRNVMSVLFNHAIRYEWLEQGRNRITLVRQSAQRRFIPAVLEPSEIQSLLSALESPFRVMVLLGVTTGLRRSELFALKWKDIDFYNLSVDIKRSIFQGVVGHCKNATSRQQVPLSLDVAADLWLWKEVSN